MTSRKLSALLAALLFLVFQQAAFAHAILIQATPKQTSTVAGPKVAISLKFNSRIDAKRSTVSLLLPDGKVRSVPLAEQPGPDTLAAEASNLTPGKYRLRWQVLATDGHITRGDYPFAIQ